MSTLSVTLIVCAAAFAQDAALPSIESLRAAAQERMRADLQRYSRDEFRKIEALYQMANRDLRASGAAAALEQLVREYPQSNRAGCAQLYLARRLEGEERETQLKRAIASHSDARYGDGTQVGAFARALLATHYARTDRMDEAKQLAAEVQAQFPGAVDHRGNRLADTLRRMNLLDEGGAR